MYAMDGWYGFFMFLMMGLSVAVLGLLVYIAVRFAKGAH
jgi:hypothetical protein